MALYVVKHQHKPETCPAKDPKMGAMLLMHISKPNAAKMGVNIIGDAVVDGQHTFYIICEAADKAKVQGFMTPFAQAGSVEIMQSSSCEKVVANRGC